MREIFEQHVRKWNIRAFLERSASLLWVGKFERLPVNDDFDFAMVVAVRHLSSPGFAGSPRWQEKNDRFKVGDQWPRGGRRIAKVQLGRPLTAHRHYGSTLALTFRQ